MTSPSSPTTAQDVSRWWREFEIPDNITFLNHAAFGPLTRRARQAIESYMDRWGRFASGPDVDQESYALLDRARGDFAHLINIDARRVAIAPNASYGLNTILWGIDWKPGDRILVPEVEFPAIVYVVQHLAEQRGLHVEVLPCPNEYFAIDDLDRALAKGAAAFVFSWVQYFNGYRYDLGEIARCCHAHDCFALTDATQGVGAVHVDGSESGIDALVCAGQKWLFGQPGSGFFYIGTDTIRPVEPPFAGWMGVDWSYRFNDLRRWDRPRYDDGRRWEVATYPYFALRAAAEGVHLLRERGPANVWSDIQGLLTRLKDGLADSPYKPFPLSNDHDSGILAIEGPKAEQLREFLLQRDIYASYREGRVRVSPHFYNREADIDRLLEAIHDFEKTQ